jgi:hypothetical protein
MSDKDKLLVGDAEAEIRQLNKIVDAFNSINKSIDKSNASLNNFSSRLKSLKGELSDTAKTARNEFRLGDNDRRAVSRNNSSSGNKNQSKIIEGEFKELVADIKREATKDTTRYLSNIIGAKNKDKMQIVLNIAAKGKSLIDIGKLASAGGKAGTAAKLGSAGGASAGANVGAGAAIGAGSVATAGLAVAVLGLAAAAAQGQKRTSEFSSAMITLGRSLNDTQKSSINTNNSLREGTNALSNFIDDITMKTRELFNIFAAGLGTLIGNIDASYKGENKVDATLSTADISTRLRESGYDLDSAEHMASITRQIGKNVANIFGEKDQEDTIKKIADAWIDGSNAAAKYGAIVDDNTLAGYMASQGVDIVNVEITDAMKQYYRLQLLQTELAQSDSRIRQKQIQDWKKLGLMMDSTKQKLFSFDEVIQLSAQDYNIPVVDSDGNPVSGDKLDDKIIGNKVPLEPKLDPDKVADCRAKLDELCKNRSIGIDVGINNPEIIKELRNEFGKDIVANVKLRVSKETLADAEAEEQNNYMESYFQNAVEESMLQAGTNSNRILIDRTSTNANAVPITSRAGGFDISSARVSRYEDALKEADAISGYDIMNTSESERLKGLLTLITMPAVAANASSALGKIFSGGAASAVASSAMSGNKVVDISSYFMNKASGFAGGGIGTKESLIHAFEGNHAEAVIPLETQAGIDYLANAMREANTNQGTNGGNNIEISLNVGTLIADNEEQIDKMTRMISDRLGILLNDRGGLGYGSF